MEIMSEELYKQMVESMENERRDLEILWRETANGARIDRVFGQEMVVTVPDYIEGIPVTEVGTYCFSASERFSLANGNLTAIGQREKRIEEPSMPQISGKYVEEIILPDSVTTIENAAFYNCRNLKRISMGTGLSDIGSDVFTNCTHLTKVIIRGTAQGKTGLPLFIERIKTEVEAFFYPEKDVCESVVFFPEYYEWMDEITPAHTFNRVIVGEGFRMRQCFQDHCLQFSKYDQSFASSVKVEGTREVCQISMDRLRWPVSLTDEAKKLYEETIEERFDTVIELVVKDRDLSALQFLCQSFSPDSQILTNWMEKCIQADWTEGNVCLMEQKHQGSTFADKSFDFDEFDDF